jgi:co-chaperonin GroES (HSP10)
MRVISGDALNTVEAKVGLKIPDSVLNRRPTGDLVVVVVAPAEERTEGGIYKPESTRRAEEGGAGYIISIGPDVGERLAEAAGTSDLLGLPVVWGRYAGEGLVVYDIEEEYRTRFRIIDEEKILLVEPPQS